jgi:crotonobetainyl-CoA:carnitine CoA-transferase CaiB-like acyl-CoA transferase
MELGTAPTLGTPIRIGGASIPPGTPPPPLGGDTVAALREAGLSDDELDALITAGVPRETGRPAPAG